MLSGCSTAAQPGSTSSPDAVASPTVSATADAAAAQGDASSPAGAPTTAPDLPTTAAAIDQPVSFGTGVSVEVLGTTVTQVTAQTPGEVDGSAVIVRVRVVNASSSPVDLDSAVVSLSATDGEVGIGTTAGTNAPFAGQLAPGASADATYTFMLGSPAGRDVTVTVNYAAGQPVAAFTGKIA